MKRPRARHPFGFTLIELLVVILILAILVALLLPTILGAIQTARNSAVSSEINSLAQALADFKTRYGDYPPSRVILAENGALDTSSTVSLSQVTWLGGSQPVIAGVGVYGSDITYGQLAQRSLRFFRKFWPRTAFSPTSTQPAIINNNFFYDFNGDGAMAQQPIYLEGHEALVFFLGGLPNRTTNSSGATVLNAIGFSKDPTNPFISVPLAPRAGNPAAQTNRQQAFFEFRSDRLIDEDGDGMPAYADTLGTGDDVRFYAYFASYGGGSYDPNDYNFGLPQAGQARLIPEANEGIGTTAFIGRAFRVTFQISYANNLNMCASPAPNPYTTSAPVPPTTTNPVAYQNPETFQIISPGRDREYGVGGEYLTTTNADRLPIIDAGAGYHNGTPPANLDSAIRQRERDNLTNFAASRLD